MDSYFCCPTGLKGSNYYKDVEEAYNFRIKSETGKWKIERKFYGFLYFEQILPFDPFCA